MMTLQGLRNAGWMMAGAIVVAVWAGAGCGTSGTDSSSSAPSADHAHHDHGHDHGEVALSFEQAVAQLQQHRDAVRDAFAAGTPDACHDALHQVGHLLGDLPKIAEASGLSEEQQAAVTEAAGKLMTAFGEIDKTMHGAADGADYAAVESDVDAAMETLTSTLAEGAAAEG